jgi:alkyl sulfatase BDS1-like metallo-beta-lactamase superfamily hydrolase
MIKKISLLSLSLSILVSCNANFNTKQKSALPETKNHNEMKTKDLNWDDKKDFEILEKNLIKEFNDKIKDDVTGAVIFDPADYKDQQPNAESPDTVNPSLWRQARLNNYRGLYKVVDGVYQVRGADMANMSIVETPNGYVVMDVLTTRETAKAAMDLFYKASGRPNKPILAMIYSHPHADHYGGSSAIATQDDVKNGKIMVIAPEGMNESVAKENVVAGTAMARRALNMYGAALDDNNKGHVDSGLGKYLPKGGHAEYIVPSVYISKDATNGQKMMIDGVEFIFQMTLGTEAPEEMNIYIPQYKALFMAENMTHTMHNMLTPRGALVRNAAAWAEYLQKSLNLFGTKAEVMFNAHHWPTFTNAEVVRTIEKTRNLIKQLHDQSVRMINKGYKMDEVANYLTLSPEITKEWHNRPYYGEYRFNARAIYQYYLGFFSGNPVDLNRLAPVDAGKRFVDTVGGLSQVMKKANKAFKSGDYQWAAEMMNHAVMAYPQDKQARYLLADIYEQMGYEAESAVHRNFYLTGSKELRGELDTSKLVSPVIGTLPALSPVEIFNFIGSMVNIDKLQGINKVVEVLFTDTNTKIYVIIQDSVVIPTTELNYRTVDETVSVTKQAMIDNLTAALLAQPYQLSDSMSKTAIATLMQAIEPPKSSFNIVTSAVE